MQHIMARTGVGAKSRDIGAKAIYIGIWGILARYEAVLMEELKILGDLGRNLKNPIAQLGFVGRSLTRCKSDFYYYFITLLYPLSYGES